MSPHHTIPRFEVQQPRAIACVSWRPCSTLRHSRNPINPGVPVSTEDLIVGDESGDLYYYLVEWPLDWEVTRDNWPGSISLVAKLTLHTQQICGIAWSSNGELFATGGNDNLCYLFKAHTVLAPQHIGLCHDSQQLPRNLFETSPASEMQRQSSHDTIQDLGSREGPERREHQPSWEHATVAPENVRVVTSGFERHVWTHRGAVKAIAFCPWVEGLVATGGGSNDKCIHFFHASSGSELATITVAAQVTSLIWSATRREIVATFGYAHPEHPYRIAVFSWPDCTQLAAIP